MSSSSSGVAPGFPESGWKVLWQDALRRYFDHFGMVLSDAIAIEVWIEDRLAHGPPDDGIPSPTIEDDLYIAPIAGTRVTVDYRVIESEYLILVREFR